MIRNFFALCYLPLLAWQSFAYRSVTNPLAHHSGIWKHTNYPLQINAIPLVKYHDKSQTLSYGMKDDEGSDFNGRTFVSYVVYKGKAAASFKILPPTFNSLSANSRVVGREGGILLEMAPAGSQPRTYDWSKKGTFLLDATECGEMLLLQEDSKNGIEFVHDPNMGGELSGQITKKVKILPTPDGRGYFLTLMVSDKSQGSGTSTFSIPVTRSEFRVIQEILTFAIPRILGFDQIWRSGGLPMNEMPQPPDAPVWKRLT